jgi:hypothetical protein
MLKSYLNGMILQMGIESNQIFRDLNDGAEKNAYKNYCLIWKDCSRIFHAGQDVNRNVDSVRIIANKWKILSIKKLFHGK